MGKIIKNNVIYGGVPDEVVTAWETEDVQDLPEFEYGDADISGIGDGSLTGAIAEHESDISTLNSKLINNFNNIKMKYFTKSVIVPDGSTSTPSTADIDISDQIPSGSTVCGAFVFLGSYLLPYVEAGSVKTWEYVVSNTKIRLANITTGWGTQTAYILVFYR